MKITALFILAVLISTSTLSQTSFLESIRLDANFNIANKKRSYSVYSDSKYANTGYFLGIDLSLYYRFKNLDAGIEFFPYNHFNVFAGYNILKTEKVRITPNLKFGYTPLLNKTYYGGGIKFSYKWLNLSYNKILHIKSGISQYHGDGLDCFSLGVTLKIPQNKEIPFRTTNGRGFLN